jgi:hypothetical protein
VVDGLQRLHEILTPSPIASTAAADGFATMINGWDELKKSMAPLDDWSSRNIERLIDLESKTAAVVAGQTLLNFDVRADNILIAGDLVYFVDWPWARIGAPFVEWVALAPSVHMQGGPTPEELVRMASLDAVDDFAINAVIASITGFFLGHSRRPPPPGNSDGPSIPGRAGKGRPGLAPRANRLAVVTPPQGVVAFRRVPR